MMHYHEDNQYADQKKAEGNARLITDQNLFVINDSEKSNKYFHKNLQSLTQAIPISSTRISKRQIGLVLDFMRTAFSAVMQCNSQSSKRKHGKQQVNTFA
jgi:hypothetical protein